MLTSGSRGCAGVLQDAIFGLNTSLLLASPTPAANGICFLLFHEQWLPLAKTAQSAFLSSLTLSSQNTVGGGHRVRDIYNLWLFGFGPRPEFYTGPRSAGTAFGLNMIFLDRCVTGLLLEAPTLARLLVKTTVAAACQRAERRTQRREAPEALTSCD